MLGGAHCPLRDILDEIFLFVLLLLLLARVLRIARCARLGGALRVALRLGRFLRILFLLDLLLPLEVPARQRAGKKGGRRRVRTSSLAKARSRGRGLTE